MAANPKDDRWCFTIMNPTMDDYQRVQRLHDTSSYIVYEDEICPTTGTPHIQGYVEFDTRCLQSVAKKRISPRCHLEPARGTAGHNLRYCSKEGRNFVEVGTPKPEKKQGHRSDLDALIEAVEANKTEKEIANELPRSFLKFHSGITKLLMHRAQPRNFKSEVYVFWGPSDVGKSRRVYDMSPNCYAKATCFDLWFDGYDGKSDVLLDEFEGQFPHTYLYRLLDRYPMQVAVKGGFVNFAPKRIFITSNVPPDQWYKKLPDPKALRRRLEHVIELKALPDVTPMELTE